MSRPRRQSVIWTLKGRGFDFSTFTLLVRITYTGTY